MRKYHVRFLEGLGAVTRPCLLSKTVDACRGKLFGTLSFVFEGGKSNEPQGIVLEKNGRFGTINGAVNL